VIIAIDAASSDLSLALAAPDGSLVGDDAWPSAQRQSAELLPRLLDLLARHGHELRAVTAVAIGTGPGSFTGLRVAMALAKGVAFALDRPIHGFPSLDAWLEAQPDAVAAVARAGARDAYVLPRGAEVPGIVAGDELASRLAAARVVAPTELAEAFGLSGMVRPHGAPAMARAAAARVAAGESGDDLATLEPIYLRAPRGVSAEAEGRVTWL
jgi:tRNA threonylcarbamoyl adenosine modification protein YeaZ